MVDSATIDLIVVRKIYGSSDPTMTMEDQEHTQCFANLNKITQKHITHFLQFEHKAFYKDYKDTKVMDIVQAKPHVIQAWLEDEVDEIEGTYTIEIKNHDCPYYQFGLIGRYQIMCSIEGVDITMQVE